MFRCCKNQQCYSNILEMFTGRTLILHNHALGTLKAFVDNFALCNVHACHAVRLLASAAERRAAKTRGHGGRSLSLDYDVTNFDGRHDSRVVLYTLGRRI